MTVALDRVVVGNGAAAAEAVLALRSSAFSGRLDLFADVALPPYNPMLGTYYAGDALPRAACFPFGDDGFYESNGARAHLSSAVVRIDPAARTLTPPRATSSRTASACWQPAPRPPSRRFPVSAAPAC